MQQQTNRFIGKTFHNLFIIDYAYFKNTELSSYYKCRCLCGNFTDVIGYQLLSGHKRSCGCLARKCQSLSRTPEYKVWSDIKQRCNNPNNIGFKNYGGRGIFISPQWSKSYLAFYRDMGPRPSDNHSIERIDKNGNYELGNCKWATRVEQNNNRRNNIKFDFNNKYLSISEIARELNIPRSNLEYRLKLGYSLNDILNDL